MKGPTALALAAILLAACASRPPPPAPAVAPPRKDWPAHTQAKLQQIHDVLAAAHPGAVPGEDADFVRWLETGLAESRVLSATATSTDTMRAVLRFYTTGFRDGHVAISSQPISSDAPLRWAGWRVALHGERYLVDQLDTQWPIALPPLGAQLLDCDGRTPQAIVAEDLAPYNDRRLELESTRMHLALFISVDAAYASSPRRRLARQCRFLLADGREQTLDQVWREPTPTTGEKPWPPAQGLRDLGNGIYWVHASDFQPDADAVRALDALALQLRALKTPKLIIFDLRGNQGGSGAVGMRILEATLGDYSQRQVAAASGSAQFRVSSIAIDTMNQRLQDIGPKHGTDSSIYRYVALIRDELQEAQQHRQTWYAQPEFLDTQIINADNTSKPRAPYRGAIALITDSWCASACLDFADQIVAIRDAVHLGQPTAADTVYNDVGFVDLGDGFELVVPLKVFRQRTRGHNQPLIPQYRYDGDIRDTSSLQAWTLETLQQHFSTRENP